MKGEVMKGGVMKGGVMRKKDLRSQEHRRIKEDLSRRLSMMKLIILKSAF